MMNRRLRSMLLVSGLAPLCAGLAFAAAAEDKVNLEPARRDQTVVCTDGKSHFVAVAPHEIMSQEIFYGDGKRFYQVALPPRMTLSGKHFLDPRVVSKTGNPNFRGIDVRLYSEVDLDVEKKTCSVRCGDRVTKLNIVDADKARNMLKAASFEPSPMQYKPYALVRDEMGVYYYVDRGTTSQNQGSFRLYKGPKGDLKRQQMTNIVSDSEGDIFATKNGSLRLILDRGESTWVEESKRTKLTIVPVEQNMPLIFNDLGVYTGQPLGTPCDHL
jgi:hypothetical protein